MSLIDETKKLRELEQQAKDAPDWPAPVEEAVYTYELIKLAPTMLSVLECFQKGDAQRLQKILNYEMLSSGDFAAVCRLQKAAGLMEQEEREG